MKNASVFQIYYDDYSRRSLDPGFLPLDNRQNLRPDWYELHVIRSYLMNTALEEGRWYGFLSPKFYERTGVSSGDIERFIEYSEGKADVGLISLAWDQIAYFQNPFEQGEVWHPGITDISQALVDHMGLGLDLRKTVFHSANFAFCNYIIAKPNYWRSWLEMANSLHALAENDDSDMFRPLNVDASYSSAEHRAPIKAFIQERLPFLVMLKGGFKASVYSFSASAPIFDRLFNNDDETRALLQQCDLLKQKYTRTNDDGYFVEYMNTRRQVAIKI